MSFRGVERRAVQRRLARLKANPGKGQRRRQPHAREMFDGLGREQTLGPPDKRVDAGLGGPLLGRVVARPPEKVALPRLNALGRQLGELDRVDSFDPCLKSAAPVIALVVAGLNPEAVGDDLA